jgi:hypothetical protein
MTAVTLEALGKNGKKGLEEWKQDNTHSRGLLRQWTALDSVTEDRSTFVGGADLLLRLERVFVMGTVLLLLVCYPWVLINL